MLDNADYMKGMEDLWNCLAKISSGTKCNLTVGCNLDAYDVNKLLKDTNLHDFIRISAYKESVGYTNYRCTKCGYGISSSGDNKDMNFCNRCGAELEKEIIDCSTCIHNNDLNCIVFGCKGEWKYRPKEDK